MIIDNNNINIIIFSKDRAMQLDACLSSLKCHFKDFGSPGVVNPTVVFKASTNEYMECYETLMKDHPEFKFVQEGTFRIDVLNSMDLDNQYTMFLVDDIIFKDDFSLSDDVFSMLKNNNQMLALSLRLHKNATYCYATDSNMMLPKFNRFIPDKFGVWSYIGCDGDWGYGFSVDGNIYNTKFISMMVNQIDFNNPNSFEANLNHPSVNVGIRPIYMCCYAGISKLLNVPANRVQNVFQNRYEKSYDPNILNSDYKNGKRIDLTDIRGCDNMSVHYPIEYKFIQK